MRSSQRPLQVQNRETECYRAKCQRGWDFIKKMWGWSEGELRVLWMGDFKSQVLRNWGKASS